MAEKRLSSSNIYESLEPPVKTARTKNAPPDIYMDPVYNSDPQFESFLNSDPFYDLLMSFFWDDNFTKEAIKKLYNTTPEFCNFIITSLRGNIFKTKDGGRKRREFFDGKYQEFKYRKEEVEKSSLVVEYKKLNQELAKLAGEVERLKSKCGDYFSKLNIREITI